MISSVGKCSCGQTKVIISLPKTLDHYSPRACDCDFCISRNISYLSDPEGKLEIKSVEALDIQKQGSNQASFITCNGCKSVIAASLQLENKLIGALNSALLSNVALLQGATTVSPKALGAKAKIERWQTVWLNIKINGNSRI
ncbi:aldehyde-activating protein [Alginatibacterium sediminis]|uniref:Aldehyde-activating protein n=1 Tax=Alginatibacterium sediminis TaxID=2164068 RepID=A0A420EBS3_9ALTE|nr:aldehyde-activating protein [Alginatibacterium sediminis]RKF18139.1 aldehyde-activating protein [Alginatibacterium sediminis]